MSLALGWSPSQSTHPQRHLDTDLLLVQSSDVEDEPQRRAVTLSRRVSCAFPSVSPTQPHSGAEEVQEGELALLSSLSCSSGVYRTGAPSTGLGPSSRARQAGPQD